MSAAVTEGAAAASKVHCNRAPGVAEEGKAMFRTHKKHV
jgi:hypothetical protein